MNTNNVRFVFSEEEDLASGPGTRLDHLELSCGRSFITVKKDRENFRHRHQKGDRESYQGLIYFSQTCSHNMHLKLTRLELTIERSYRTHSHNIHLKITRLVRRFLLKRRNMSFSKIHCYYIIISTELKGKHTLEQDEFCCVIISSGLQENSLMGLRQSNVEKNVCLFLLLVSPRPLSPPWGCQTSYQPT